MAKSWSWAWGMWLFAAVALGADAAPTAADAAAMKRAGDLIAELGSPHFATREKAAAELSQLGLSAFDALHAAQTHPDHEISERARYLLHSMKFVWSRPGDSADVKRLLKDYSAQSEKDQQTRIEHLALLDHGEGIPALCRLVRYEMSLDHAKQAALAIIHRPDAASQQNLIETSVAETLSTSKRAAEWLRAFVMAQRDPAAAMKRWPALVEAERETLVKLDEDKPSLAIVRGLYRFQADTLQQLGRESEAQAAVEQLLGLCDGTPPQIVELLDWLAQRKNWKFVDLVVGKFPESFEKHALLKYRQAEAYADRGDKDQAEKLALQALELEGSNYQQHVLLAFQLQERGRFAWSEREYRRVIKAVEMTSTEGIDARLALAEMLHDQEQDVPAADAISDLVDAMEADPTVFDTVRNNTRRRSPYEIISRRHYFRALEHLRRKELKEAKSELTKGADAFPDDEDILKDADLLISMYRFPEQDASWKRRVDQMIDETAAGYKRWIVRARDYLESASEDQDVENAKRVEAMFCNQFAWLIGNTRGDFAEAISLSKRSLELVPQSGGYMDTLAHCYFTTGDLDSAVKWQTKAARLDPHSGQIKRALARFERAASEKSQTPPK